MFPTRTPAFEDFIAPALRRPRVWRILAGLATLLIVYLGLMVGYMIALGRMGYFPAATLTGRGTEAETILMLLSFLGLSLGVVIAAGLFHKRGLKSLIGPDLRVFWRYFALTAVVVFCIFGVLYVVYFMISPPVPHLGIAVWISWLPLALLAVFVQTTAEELVFRGYLQQQLAARFRSRWVWWVLPSVLFGLAHFDSTRMGANTWLVVLDTILVGLIAADFTVRTGNLGAAMALHFVNNFFAILVLSLKGTITGLALFVTPFGLADHASIRWMVIADIVTMALLYGGYLIIMQRRDARRLHSNVGSPK